MHRCGDSAYHNGGCGRYAENSGGVDNMFIWGVYNNQSSRINSDIIVDCQREIILCNSEKSAAENRTNPKRICAVRLVENNFVSK